MSLSCDDLRAQVANRVAARTDGRWRFNRILDYLEIRVEDDPLGFPNEIERALWQELMETSAKAEYPIDRMADAFEKIASALDRIATLQRERFEREYPPERQKRAAEITRPEDEKEKQFSDKADDEWIRETEAAMPPSRFQERYDKQRQPKPNSK